MTTDPLALVVVALAVVALGVLAAGLVGHLHARRSGRAPSFVERHDLLTGLPNRTSGVELVERQHLSGRPYGLVVIDLDRFASVNDSYGQELGDRLLRAVVERVQAGLAPEETLVRWGGPQLLVLAPSIHDDAAAVRRAAEIANLVDARLQLGHDTLRVSATVGAVAIGGAVADATEAVDAAQAALRSARAGNLGTGGRERAVGVRRRGDGGGSRERVRAAMEDDEFWLLYQPIASLGDRQVHGVEAVLHWSDPRRGVLHLDEVRDELDRSGLEAEVAWWALRQVAERAAAWSREFPHLELVVSTVVPTSLLCDDDLLPRLEELLAATTVPPAQLCLEVAGRTRHDLERTGGLLRQVKALGIQLGLDDFGTSWSSLSYLRRTTPDVVKIPARFVDGVGVRREDEAVVQQLVGMATSLGVVPIAEGISRPEHLEHLRSMGCDLGQGTLLGLPQPAESIEVLLRRGRVEPTASPTGR